MKKLIVATVFVLAVANVKAQDTGTGAPKQLTCTEKAFNFSFSVGERLKLSAPKMGPVEAASYETDYIPAWALKVNAIKPEKPLPSLFESNRFKVIDKSGNLFHAFNFNQAAGYPALNYTGLKPLSF